MQTQMSERRPRSKKIRLPLDHWQTDAIDLRIKDLLAAADLSDREFGELIKQRRDLKKADHFLARRLFDGALPETILRPKFFDDYARPTSGVSGSDPVECASGWVWRVRDYVEKLERKYFSRVAVADQPGDDI